MKMVSAAKYSQAERQLRPARTYGVAAQGNLTVAVWSSSTTVFTCVIATAVLDKAEVVGEERSNNHLFVVISSDRGLCGSVHSNLARTIRPIMEKRASSDNTFIVCVGDKVSYTSPVIHIHLLMGLALCPRSAPFCSAR